MEFVLVIATILGGVAAIGYFIDKARKSKVALAPDSSATRLSDLESIIIKSDPRTDWSRHAHDEHTTTVYTMDVNLRFEMTFEGTGVQAEHFSEPWARGFPDADATGYFCDLYYGASLLKQFVLVSVDGARALLPLPRSRTDLTVPTLHYRIAQIHDYSQSLSRYMKLAHMHPDPLDGSLTTRCS